MQKTVNLNPGESKEVTFEIKPDAIGEYTVKVNGITGNLTVVAPPVPAELYLSNLAVSPQMVKINELVTVTVQATNVGGSRGIFPVTLYVQETLTETKQVTINPGETEMVEFKFRPQEEGHFTVQIGTLEAELYVVSEAPGFTGFSLKITGAWAPVWFARIKNKWTITNESSPWVTDPAPGMATIEVWCLNSDYSFPDIDPNGLGKEFDVVLEDGHNYILDVSQGQIGESTSVDLLEDPNPPSYPSEPVEMPMVLSYKLPDGPVQDTVKAELDVFLPQFYLGVTMSYQPQLVLKAKVLDTFSGNVYPADAVIANASFVPEDMLDAANYGSEHSDPPSQPYLALDQDDDTYHIPGVWNALGKRFESAPLIGWHGRQPDREGPVIPGRYPVQAIIKYAHCVISGGEFQLCHLATRWS